MVCWRCCNKHVPFQLDLRVGSFAGAQPGTVLTARWMSGFPFSMLAISWFFCVCFCFGSRKSEEFPWKKKKSKAFFRGSRTSSERDPLVKYARQNPSYADAAYTKNQAWKSDADTLGKPPAGEISLADHCKYKYLFNFRGVAASFRFKHLFMCRSLVVHVGEDWKEFFYPAMKPWVHYIPMDVEMKDLPVMIEFVRKYDKVARAIADRGYKFVDKHLRLKDIELYWKNLLLTYHSLMQWKPKRDMSLKQIK
eukprot:scpid61377/ scgid6557/ Protein O-glucosyltransferase 1; CAP10-like 46 kDa protein; KTEL motif-containing protein 1